MSDALLVLTTAADDEQARTIATHLVESRLAACVNIVPRIASIYRWEGRVAEEQESLLICKTRPERFDDVRDAIRRVHSYDVPEVVAIETADVDPDYLAWLRAST